MLFIKKRGVRTYGIVRDIQTVTVRHCYGRAERTLYRIAYLWDGNVCWSQFSEWEKAASYPENTVFYLYVDPNAPQKCAIDRRHQPLASESQAYLAQHPEVEHIAFDRSSVQQTVWETYEHFSNQDFRKAVIFIVIAALICFVVIFLIFLLAIIR